MTRRQKHPGGRPPVAVEARTIRRQVRLTPDEDAHMRDLAERHGMSVTEWMRTRVTSETEAA